MDDLTRVLYFSHLRGVLCATFYVLFGGNFLQCFFDVDDEVAEVVWCSVSCSFVDGIVVVFVVYAIGGTIGKEVPAMCQAASAQIPFAAEISYEVEPRELQAANSFVAVATLSIAPPSAQGQRSSFEDIDRWHRSRGWKSCGYHFVVRRDGTVESGRPVEEVGAHCRYHNKYSIGVCYEGGLDEDGKPADTRTSEQKVAMRRLIARLLVRFPRAIVVGHHDLDPMKECPCFDVVGEFL